MVTILDPEELLHNTGDYDMHAVQTIQLGELVEDNIFTWERCDWKEAAYSEEQYTRVCNAFIERFYFREISITPVKAWLMRLHYELVYNLMPKYRPLYAQLEAGDYDPLQSGGEYAKERKIESEFPETLLSENQDYASRGYDYVRESIGRANLVDDAINYFERFKSIDAMLLSELEDKLFSCLYTTNVNGW